MNRAVKADPKAVRNVNRAAILNLIRENQPVSRIELSKLSHLNKSTVSSIVADLLEEKLISETMIGESTGGRKPILLNLNRSGFRIGAIDFDPECTYVAIGDIEANIIRKKAIQTENSEPAAFVKRCLLELLALKDELNCPNLKSIGLSIPGIVDTKKGLVVIAPDLQWKNFDIRKIVQEVDSKGRNGKVIMDNEANSSALAEQWFGKEVVKNKSNIVFISEGIGTGIILNRELIQGSYDGAGQLGHMTIDPDGERCICGNHGCWELYTSKEKTVKRFHGEDFNGNVNGELGKIIALALNGDEGATNALWETGRYLGIGISNIIKAIDPEVVVLGGMIAQAWEIIRDDISEEIGKRVFFDIKKKNALVVPTSLVERSSLIGAFTLVIREIFRGYRITR